MSFHEFTEQENRISPVEGCNVILQVLEEAREKRTCLSEISQKILRGLGMEI